jgi:hypothetical protein
MIYSLHTRWLWGDYGSTLINGHSKRDPATGGWRLDRVGPFVPPLMLPFAWDGSPVLVPPRIAEPLRQLFPSLKTRPTQYGKVVRLAWHRWDLNAQHPKVHPEGGEPENYILSRPHSAETAAEMEPIVELLLPEVATPTLTWDSSKKTIDEHGRIRYLGRYIAARKFEVAGLCKAADRAIVLCDERISESLKPLFGEWVRFEPILRKRLGRLRPM